MGSGIKYCHILGIRDPNLGLKFGISDEKIYLVTTLIIVRFVSREDRNLVWAKRGKIKQTTSYTDAYITEDFARAIQEERKVLIKAMFKAKGLGVDNAKVIARYLIIDNQKYDFSTIPTNLK